MYRSQCELESGPLTFSEEIGRCMREIGTREERMNTNGRITQACSRVLYHGEDGIVITGRTMDWFEDMHTSLRAFPAGMHRDGYPARLPSGE